MFQQFFIDGNVDLDSVGRQLTRVTITNIVSRIDTIVCVDKSLTESIEFLLGSVGSVTGKTQNDGRLKDRDEFALSYRVDRGQAPRKESPAQSQQRRYERPGRPSASSNPESPLPSKIFPKKHAALSIKGRSASVSESLSLQGANTI